MTNVIYFAVTVFMHLLFLQPLLLSQSEQIDYYEFDNYFQDIENFSGTVLVAVDGKALFRKSYGLANRELNVKNTPQTKFKIGSLTKQFTAMAILILEEQGKLKVRDKISKHLFDLPVHWEDISIHELLTHTSGLMHSWALSDFSETMMQHASIEATIDRFKNQPLVARPGEKFNYSGVGYFLLAMIIERISGLDYEDFLKNEIFDKIGMVNTGADLPDKIVCNRASGYKVGQNETKNATYIYMPILTGGGNLYSTVDDLLRWDQALHNNVLISEQTKEIMFTPEQNNYAYGWSIRRTEGLFKVSHTGRIPGFQSLILRFPEKKILIVMLSNATGFVLPRGKQRFEKIVLEELGKE